MRKVHSGLILGIVRKTKLYLGLISTLCVILLVNGYFRQKEYYDNSPISLHDHFENVELTDLTNRRHNRNLQHLYDLELSTEFKKDLNSKINKNVGRAFYLFTNNDGEKHEATYNTHLNHHQKQNVFPEKRLPKAIIIGVKKGGTRALLEFLRAHPDVKATGPEPHFFDKNYEKGLEWYRNLMPKSESSQLTIEKTPGYFITKDVPKRIYNMSADVKLIVVVRDPVTRAISDFAQIASKSTKHQSFETTVFKDNETTVDTSKTIVKVGIYSNHFERWLKYFPRGQFHIVNGENLVTDPGTEITKIQEFLGLPVLITHKHFYFNQSRGFPCILKKPGKKPHCLDDSKGRKHPNINPTALKSLREFYRPFNHKFNRMVGENFDWS